MEWIKGRWYLVLTTENPEAPKEEQLYKELELISNDDQNLLFSDEEGRLYLYGITDMDSERVKVILLDEDYAEFVEEGCASCSFPKNLFNTAVSLSISMVVLAFGVHIAKLILNM